MTPRSRLLAIAQESKGHDFDPNDKRWLDALAAVDRQAELEMSQFSESDTPSERDVEEVASSSDGSVPDLVDDKSTDSFEVSTESDDSDDDGSDIDFDRINREPLYKDHDDAVRHVCQPYDSGDDDGANKLEPSSVADGFRLARRSRLLDPTVPDIGMQPAEMNRFMLFSPPKVLLAILALMAKLPEYVIESLLDTIELFSGEAECTNNFAAMGLASLSYDIKDDKKYHNLNACWGFIHALQCLRRLRRRRGCAWMGTVCSTWVFMSRASTRRTLCNPQGDTTRRCVVNGNRQASRSALVMAYCYAVACGFVLEQPASSLLFYHPSLLHVQRVAVKLLRSRFHRVSLYMHHYNAKHFKKTELLSNETWVHALSNSHPGKEAASDAAPTATVSVRADGKKTTTGTKHLKATQTYTPEFGKACANSIMSFRTYFDADVDHTRGQLDLPDLEERCRDPWSDASLDCVADALIRYHQGTGALHR